MAAPLFRRLRELLTLGFVPAPWRVPCFMALGAVLGLGGALSVVSRATSYLGDDAETCVNCHVMRPQYATWLRSSHATVTNCNDCHVPHDDMVSHYAFKARDGLYHSAIFTLRWEPQVIRISAGAVPVVEANCRRCHQDVVEALHLAEPDEAGPRCWDCHREVPHGRVRSLSATPPVMDPRLPHVLDPTGGMTVGGRAPRPASREENEDD